MLSTRQNHLRLEATHNPHTGWNRDLPFIRFQLPQQSLNPPPLAPAKSPKGSKPRTAGVLFRLKGPKLN